MIRLVIRLSAWAGLVLILVAVAGAWAGHVLAR